MRLTVTHTLTYGLPAPVRAVQHVLLTALPTPQQRVERWSIEMPGFGEAATFRDGFGNRAHLVSQTRPGETLAITVGGTVETIDKAGVLGRLDGDPPAAMFRRPTALTRPNDAQLEGLDASGGRIALLHQIMDRVHDGYGASQSQSAGGQSQSPGGTAADAAHAFIAAARALDIPARYVTGYLFDDAGEGSFHAWAEACDEGLGWIGFDPLLNRCPAERHIRLASGLDATSTLPVRMVPGGTAPPVETVEIAEG